MSFDFRYNKALSTAHLSTAAQFLAAAQRAKDEQHWSVFIDTLCSASELIAKAFLLGTADQRILKARSHDAVKAQANWHRKLGNLADEHVGSLNRVWDLRNPARYLDRSLDFSQSESEELLASLMDFYSFVERDVSGVEPTSTE